MKKSILLIDKVNADGPCYFMIYTNVDELREPFNNPTVLKTNSIIILIN